MKNTNKQKFISAALSLILCASTLIWTLSSCAKSDNNDKDTDVNQTTAENNASSTVAAETTIDKIKPDLPEMTFDNYEFKIVTKGTDHNIHWFSRDIYAEVENGEPINDAVYLRNTYVEEKYKVKIKELPQKDPYAFSNKVIKSGSDDIDIIEAGITGCNETLAASGYLYNLKQFPHLDLEKPWWDQKSIDQLSIMNKLFCATSDLAIMDEDATWIIMFNKTLVKNYGLESPYDLVNSGKWTINKMYEMMKATNKDIDADGVMTDADQFGLVTQNKNTIDFYNGSDETVCKKDDDDVPYITLINGEKSIKVLETAYEMQTNKQTTITAEDWMTKYPNDRVWDDMQLVVFAENRSLFYYAGMNRVTLLRSMDTDFGVLPAPKYDEAQKEYCTSIDFWCATGAAIPVTATNLDRTGIILEALTAESYYTLKPAYYDITLKSKLTRDTDSSQMLDIIFANRFYDIGKLYNWSALSDTITTVAGKKTMDVVSQFEKKQAAAQKAMEKTLSIFEGLAN